MSDKELKDRIHAALTVLNAALQDAAKAGLTVEVHDLDVTTMGELTRVRYINVEISRVTKI